MNNSFPLTSIIAFRYLRAKKANSSISFFSLVSLLGLALGLAALIIVISVMNGFENEMHKRILNMLPHVSVENIIQNKDQGIVIHQDNWQEIANTALDDALFNEKIYAASPFIHLDGLLNKDSVVKGIRVVGIEPEFEKHTSVIDDFLLAGSLDDLNPGGFDLILGADIAREIGVIVGESITLVFPHVDDDSGRLKASYFQFTIRGFFQVGAEADGLLAFIHLKDASAIKYKNRTIDGFRYQLHNVYDAELLQKPLKVYFGGEFKLATWVTSYGQLFQTVKIEKVMTASMLMLIVLVAAFNTISSLAMLVTEKHTSIAVLRTMGFSKTQVLMIFFYQGLYISGLGVLLGLALGITIALNLSGMIAWINSFEIIWLAPLDTVLKWQDVFWLTLCAWLISVLSSILPALNATKIEPADAVRYH